MLLLTIGETNYVWNRYIRKEGHNVKITASEETKKKTTKKFSLPQAEPSSLGVLDGLKETLNRKKLKKTEDADTESDNTESKPKPKEKGKKEKSKKEEKKKGPEVIGVPTSKAEKLVDVGIMRPHNFISYTSPMLTRVHRLTKKEDAKRSNMYEAAEEPHSVSAILKLVLNVRETNDMMEDWTLILWNMTQQHEYMLPEGAMITFNRAFERRDNDMMKKIIKKRNVLATLSSDSSDNVKGQNASILHDMGLVQAIDKGDSVMGFGAEAIVTARNEQDLEVAVDAVKNYLKANDETRGLTYELDINRQMHPYVSFGPNASAKNKDVYVEMTSWDAAVSSLFVDSGGDRTLGAEYVGVSIGKLIRSHAAYNFKKQVSLYVGNDATKKTTTMGGEINEPSQVYLSKVTSRAYLLDGKKVTHFVIDDSDTVGALMDLPIDAKRKCAVDVSKGLLNILEPIDDGNLANNHDRILSVFPTHINNIITLLSQYRDKKVEDLSVNDDFANAARDILIDFFVTNQYWSHNARYDKNDIRLFIDHRQFKMISDFGQYVAQKKKSNRERDKQAALNELDTIINGNILPTLPALNAKTDPVIDRLVNSQYRVVDIAGMEVGSSGVGVSNPSLNVMMISYLNLLLPTMDNEDVIVLHGISRVSSIARIVKEMIANSGRNIDVVYTEKNQVATQRMIQATSEQVEVTDEATGRLKQELKAMPIDFTMVDLYNNRVENLADTFNMHKESVENLKANPASFFVKTTDGLDYIYLDQIL